MRRFPLRRLVSAVLSLAIVAGAPGSQAYHAAAQTVGRAAKAAPAPVAPGMGWSGLSAPVPSLSPSLLSVSPSLLSAPAAAPEARAVPAAALAVPVRAAAASAAVPMGPAAVVPTRSPLSVAAKTGPPAVAAPSALRSLPAAAAPEAHDAAARLFDGSVAKAASPAAVAAPRAGGFARSLKKGLAILALSVGMLASQQQAGAQSVPLPQPPAVAQAQAQAQPQAQAADTVRVVLPRPLEATASVDRQGVTVGERVQLSITLRNTSDKPVTLHNLRSSIQEALPADLELQGKGAEAPLVLAPGESKTVVYEAIPFGSGTLTLDGGIAVVAVGETAVYPEGIEIVMPKTELKVATVLTADWKEKGLRDIVGVKRADGPDWMWLAAIPLGILLFVGVHRLVAARRLYPKLDAKRLSLVTVTETELERLKAQSPDLDAASFYARYQELLTGFMVDFAGMPKAARDARTLERDLRKSFYDAGQASVASRLAAQAESARFAGAESDRTERERMIERLKALVESVAGKAGKPKESSAGVLGMLALLPGAAGLTFGSPYVLLLLIPLAAYAYWSWRSGAKAARFAVSSSAQTPAKRTLREKLAGLPKVLRMAAIGLIVVALARPMIGTERTETFIPSTDTVVSIDLSGSMSGDKLQGVRDAVRGYVEEQRRGTENRVGMVTFSDESYLDMKLTTDYDALIAHLKELETTGSTAIGKSMLTSIAHFLELSALELDGKKDPRAAEVQRLLRDSGLPAALAYAKQHPDLLKTILQPERAKIVVLFTDGDSNSGIDPQAAAEIAASLGIKIYGVGIAGPNESFNEATLRGVAEKTGAKFFRAGDANAMREVLLEISRLEKSPAKIVSAVSVKDYTSLLALLAFLLIGAELTLVNTRLRTLYGLAFMMALNQAPMDVSSLASVPAAAVTAQASAPKSLTQSVPAEVIEGNKLYNQGRFAEALKKYAEAVERHPDVPEIYFNMADAYLRLGQNEKADAAWAKYLSLTPDAKKQSQTLFNLANSALMAKDAEKAIELYKEALRRDATNMDAKWNLESLKQQQKEQEEKDKKEGKDSKKGKPGKQKGKQDGKDGKDGKPSTDGKPGDGKPGDGKPGDGKPGDGKPGDGKPGEGKPKDAKEGADKLGEELGKQEGGEKDAARKGMTRKGSGVWGIGALPLAFAGQGLVFSSSMFLWAVGIGLPILIIAVAWGIKKRMDAAKRLSPGTAPKTFRSWWGARRFLGKSALALAAAGLIGLAAGDPRGGMVDERVNFGGKDIVVTVDGSHSMVFAEDGRMARTQKELNEFITRLQGTDRVGLVVFAGKSRTASPISIDYGNFEFKINRLDVESRGIGEGSNLAAAIKYSANHFETAKKLGDRQRILIIISDGDVPDSEIAAAIASAAEHNVTVYAIGVGDPAGTKILMPTADGTGTEYLIDSKTGQPAITRLNEAPLRQLAERTGGAFFRAGEKTSIDDVLSEVSRLEKGQKGDLIKSPSPVGVYLLWPALLMLLLDLILPGRSLLRRGASTAKPEEKAKKSGPGAAGLLGAALIPLGAWPQILPFAALATVVAAYIAADSWSGGKITRTVREWWQSRRGFIENGVSSDLIHLYDLREVDERRLASFVKGWRDAKEPLRETMIDIAVRDDALWREKLTAVYMTGGSPELLEKVLTALRRAARQKLEPLSPITTRMALRKASISWMAHTDAEVRLAALTAVAAGQTVAFEAPKPVAKPSGFFARFKQRASVAVLAVMIAVTGVSSVGTMNFRVEQRAAAEVALKLFYAEDLFVFSDRYVDERITREVIPALKRWHESPKTAGDDFERALTILRESPDPKADNILVTIFRHSGVLPLTQQAENTLLRSLIERESDALWGSMEALIAQSRTDAASAQMLVKLVILGVEVGDEKTLAQLFRVLKSPNKQVQQQAAGVLYAHLSRDAGAKFYEGLTSVQAKHASDPMLQMWTASFALRRLTEPSAAEADLVKAKGFLDKALVNARAIDAARIEIYKQTPPDQEVQAPPSLVAMLANLASSMQGDGGAPAPLAGAARYLVTKATTQLIQDAEKTIPGLHERLVKDGVVLPDTQSSSSYGGYDDYDDHGHGGYYGRGGRFGGGYTSTTQNYREVYKLAHLRALQAAIDEMGGASAKTPTKENFAQRELVERAGMIIEQGLEAGAKSGMMEGGTAPEAAAEQLYSTLKAGDGVFANHSFLRALRDAGLAPASGDLSSQLAYPESLDAAQMKSLRDLLVTVARSGNGWDAEGKPRALTWSEKLYLSGAIETVEAARLKNYPDAEKLAAADLEPLALAAMSRELTAKPSPALALELEARLFARAAKGPVDGADASALLAQVFTALKGSTHEAAALDALAVALKAPNGAAFKSAALMLAVEGLHQVAERAENATPGLKAKHAAAGVRESETSWRPDVKLRHFRVVAEGLTGADAAALARYTKLAALAGAPSGESAGELAADEVNVVLLAGYRLFPGSEFNEALRAAGLMKGDGNTLSDYQGSYDRQQLTAIRAWLAGVAKANAGLGKDARELKLTEKVYLANALDRVDAILAARFGVAAAPVPADVLGSVSRPGQEALALARLSLELDKRKGDAAYALKAQDALFAILAARPGDAVDAGGVLDAIRAAVKGTSSEQAQLSAMVKALKTTHGKELLESVAEDAEKAAQSLAEDAEKLFPALNKALIDSGAREDDDSWRGEFKLRHYRELRAAIAAAAKVKNPTAEQRAAAERAARLLPLLEAAATTAGVLPGDTPGEIAAELINEPLQKGYQVFPGAVFNEKLRDLKLMDAGSSNGLTDHRQTYTQADLVKLRDFLSTTLSSGQGWESDGKTRRALTDSEKETLQAALAATDRALAAYAKPAKTFAFAPLALAALPALGLAPILLFAVMGLGAAYIVWKLWPSITGAEETEAVARESIPGSIIARHRRIELVARRMATAVNGGNFRSRFIGPGGTDFAEARPYQGEDMREIDWKTSAKKDELYAKKFELERDMPLMLVVDISRSGSFGTRGTTKREAIENSAAVLALAAAHSNVRVGLVLVSDRVEQVIPARGGARHAMMIVDAILKAEPSGKATDLKPGLEAAGKLLGSRSMVAVLSDFIAPDFKDALGSIASRHDVRAIRVTDPAELAPLPDVGLLPVVDAETGETRMLDTSSRAGRAEAAASINRREEAVEAAFGASRLKPIQISTEGDPLESLELAFHPKAKQTFTP